MMAQAIVESGWGASTLSKAPNYNLFGIKGYNGQSVYMDTWEYLNGKWLVKKNLSVNILLTWNHSKIMRTC